MIDHLYLKLKGWVFYQLTTPTDGDFIFANNKISKITVNRNTVIHGDVFDLISIQNVIRFSADFKVVEVEPALAPKELIDRILETESHS